jgi:cytochrome P450
MGRDFQSLTHSENKVADSFLAILEPSKEHIAFVAVNFTLPQWLVRRIPLRLNKVIDTEVGFLRDLCHQTVLDKRTASNLKANEEPLEADILGSMIQGGDFTDSELVDQMLTFLGAGVGRSLVLFNAITLH